MTQQQHDDTRLIQLITDAVAPLREQIQIVSARRDMSEREMSDQRAALRQLQSVVLGDAQIGLRGLLDQIRSLQDQVDTRMDAIDVKITALIDQSRARDNQLLGARKAFYALAGVLAVVGGPPAVTQIARLFGITP